jgi:mRNA interferase MazF
MEIERGWIWWADLPKPVGSAPGYRRPVVIVQANAAIDLGLQTLIVVALTTNTGCAQFPGNVSIPADTAGLAEASVVNVTQLLTVDSKLLVDFIGNVPRRLMRRIDEGLIAILDLHHASHTLQ